MIDYSLNETASRAKLAAKGAGYSWGMAEEVAKAVFWLAQRELPGPEMLLALLSNYTTSDSVNAAIPHFANECFSATDSWICPIASGCALSDSCCVVNKNTRISFTDVKYPILMLPFVADVAQRTNSLLVLEIDSVSVATNGIGFQLANTTIVNVAQAAAVVCRTANETEIKFDLATQQKNTSRVSVDESIWRSLEAFAHRTYAPSTQSSRELGAGAGLNDND